MFNCLFGLSGHVTGNQDVTQSLSCTNTFVSPALNCPCVTAYGF